MIEANDRLLVIYPANCADGFSAAWAIWKRFGDSGHAGAAGFKVPREHELATS